MTDVPSVRSVNDVPIRLPAERWRHIVEHHDEMADRFHDVLQTVATMSRAVYVGVYGELMAVSRLPDGRYLVVPYRELPASDGFVITALLVRRADWLERRPLIWTAP